MHKTKMPPACSLVEAQRPLKSLYFQDVLDYITYFITLPPSDKVQKQLQSPLWSPLTLWASVGRQKHQELWIQLVFGINWTSWIYYLQLYYKMHIYTNVSYGSSHLSTVSKWCNLFSHHSPDQTSDTVRHHASNTKACIEELLKIHLTNKIHLVKKSHGSLLLQYIICVSDSAFQNIQLFLQ